MASIAVLPFANRSASFDDEYFSDGLADELLSVLSKIKGLRVTARTSSFQFKGSKEDVPTIGRKLDVATLLEGSVRKAGNRIRVSVQLVNVADSSHLWSETYDRTLEDIFAVQDDIAHSVVKELRTLHAGDRLTEAEATYRKALELAPQMAGTHASLSLTLLAQGRGEEALAEVLPEPNEMFRLHAQAIVNHALGYGAESEAVQRAVGPGRRSAAATGPSPSPAPAYCAASR